MENYNQKLIQHGTWNVHEKFETIEFKRLRVKNASKKRKKMKELYFTVQPITSIVSTDLVKGGTLPRLCRRGKVSFHLSTWWGWFLGDKVQGESRTRSHRPASPLAAQFQARIVIGRRSWVASPTLYPTWPPTRTREITTTLPPFPGFAHRSQHIGSSFPSSNLSILSSSK